VKNGSHFFEHATESAIIGYMVVQGFGKIPDHCLVDPADFTDERWKKFYAAGLIVHKSGREANHLTINNEIKSRGWDRQLEKLFPLGWEKSWTAECDPLLV
jgi:replicative DNA helicase